MNVSKTINHSELHPSKIAEVLEQNRIYFQRGTRIKVLRDTIKSKYEAEKKELKQKEKDAHNEMGITEYIRLSRLDYSATLSEFQLESDYVYYGDENLNHHYLSSLWEKFVAHIETYPNAKKVFEDISKIEQEENEIKMNVYEYNQCFRNVILDADDCFDGVDLVIAVEHFDKTSVATEIRELAEKYDIRVPKYWVKKDMQLHIKQELNVSGKLTAEMIERIDSSSVKKLKVILEENKLNSKLHITKADIIKIIIKNVDKNKVSELAQEVEVVEFVPVAEVKEEPVVEEVVAPVVVPVVAPVDSMDYSNYLEQIIKNQELIIEQLVLKQDVSQDLDKRRFWDRFFNYVIITLIIIVSLVWIFYGFSTLF